MHPQQLLTPTSITTTITTTTVTGPTFQFFLPKRDEPPPCLYRCPVYLRDGFTVATGATTAAPAECCDPVAAAPAPAPGDTDAVTGDTHAHTHTHTRTHTKCIHENTGGHTATQQQPNTPKASTTGATPEKTPATALSTNTCTNTCHGSCAGRTDTPVTATATFPHTATSAGVESQAAWACETVQSTCGRRAHYAALRRELWCVLSYKRQRPCPLHPACQRREVVLAAVGVGHLHPARRLQPRQRLRRVVQERRRHVPLRLPCLGVEVVQLLRGRVPARWRSRGGDGEVGAITEP